MTRKDYVAVANVLSYAAGHADNDGELAMVGMIARDLCRTFRADNPRFDSRRFLTAAGLEDNRMVQDVTA